MRRPGPYDDAPRLPEGDRVDVRELVGARTIELEIGPGPKAGFLVERAAEAPDVGLVGLEIRKKWAAVGDGRLAKHGHASRARVFCEDARFALPRLGPDASVARVFLHFPDPWWKKRHQKRLVLGRALLDELARCLTEAGEIFVQTDVEERAAQYEALLLDAPAFEPFGPSPRVSENPFSARSPRERRALADGLPVYRLHFKKRPA